MSRHALRKSTARNLVASASAVSVSIGSLIAFAPASHAISCPDDSVPLGMTSNVIDVAGEDVCELIFLPNGPVTWEVPSGVSKVSALIIGGGSASEESLGEGTNYAAGGAGEVQYVDDLGTGELTITAGPGQTVGQTGWSGVSSVVGENAFSSAGGGVVRSSENAGRAWAGDSGNDFLGGKRDDDGAASGAGADGNGLAGSFSSDLAGGVGLQISDMSADTDLWPTSDTTEFGKGGSYHASHLNLVPISTYQGLGNGGSIAWLGGTIEQPGANGSIRIRFSLAATTYTVIFDANGGTGSMSNQTASSTTALTSNTFENDGYTFAGWSTEPSGTGGVSYANGADYGFTVSDTLYAQWTLDTYTVIFDANGGTGSMSNQTASSTTALTSNTFENDGYTFAGWSTEPSGTGGVSYANGADYGFTVSDTLYAQWSAVAPSAPRATPYEGPIGLRQVGQATCVGDSASVVGSRLGTIEKIYIGGTETSFNLVSDSKLNFTVPNLKAGTYQLKYWVPTSNVNLTDKITIGACSVPATEPVIDETEVGSGELTPFYIAKRFTSYRGDRGAIVAADRQAITAFIAANPGLTHITCVGSTSGQPASPTDKALAMARAENACSVVENLVPGITTRMVTSTGRGVGQFYRAVTLFGKGLREN